MLTDHNFDVHQCFACISYLCVLLLCRGLFVKEKQFYPEFHQSEAGHKNVHSGFEPGSSCPLTFNLAHCWGATRRWVPNPWNSKVSDFFFGDWHEKTFFWDWHEKMGEKQETASNWHGKTGKNGGGVGKTGDSNSCFPVCLLLFAP